MFIHETSIIDCGAKIGDDTRIWHFSHVCSSSVIGKECNLGQNVYIGPNVKIGNRVKIQNNVSVYEGVEIEDDVFCGPSMVFTNVINPRAFVRRSDNFMKTKVCKGASIGANSTIICGVTIGKYSLVAAGAVVTKDVPDYALILGAPGRLGGWVSRSGKRLRFSSEQNAIAYCPESNEKYVLKDGRCQVKVN